MKLNKEPFRNWFGFTRRERRSSFILLIIIFLIIGLRYSVPESNISIEDITAGIPNYSGHYGSEIKLTDTIQQPFLFDPNTASYDTLIMLGLVSKEARTLISYRNKGGKFRRPSDIKKVYGIDEARAEKLIPFIAVNTDTTEKVRVIPVSRQKIMIDINICDSVSLVRLPGIGPVLSARIIKYRHLLGGFARPDQLKEVYGLPEETYNLTVSSIFVDTLTIARINVNSADYKELARLPYFDKYEVTAILKYRKLMGRINGISDIVENKLITAEKAAKVSPYLRFD